MLAQAQNADEDAILPGGFIPPWAGYGRFSTVMGRRTKAEFCDEFYKRNAYVRSFFVARDHLRAYQECHVAHQRRRFARIVAYKQDRTVSMGSIAHSSSKNRLEEVNRGLIGEIPGCSDDGYSTDYDSEGDEGMERVLASMPSHPPLPVTPPTTDDGAGEDEFQPPDPFPSKQEPSSPPPAFGAEQAHEWRQPAQELSSSDDEPPGLMPNCFLADESARKIVPVELITEEDELTPYKDGKPVLLLHRSGLLPISMAHLGKVALYRRPVMISAETATEKKEEEKKEEEEDERVDGSIALDGQDQDADKDEEKGGDPT